MKKIILKKENCLYVQKGTEGVYCDFCGEENKKMFESEFESKEHCSCSYMQICYDCVEQLNKLLPK